MTKIRITQVRSIIDAKEKHKRIIRALGLGRPNYSVVHAATPQILGMVAKVSHLVRVEELTSDTHEAHR
ncbi:MAG: 50S ribosomal protein L30 [Bacteroidota bacterium]|nr:50S ribosomal protein L30 [Candidatus Kapabacteria bacterium]MCS7302358.1 50S ribosomal protein L30 [Candidatus Kapabacteria bacterium]MCX7936897.1 50S ribosomal protein L30 [Chlorobiota bacterium]MDW8075324.1 50S ribosomal protein L30 [Bacteroidota bacterium]MDW8271936.1 50S ribosomal protein L30 [Bacteroidota bacterium]